MAAAEVIAIRLEGQVVNTIQLGMTEIGLDEITRLPWNDQDVRLRLRYIAQAWITFKNTRVSGSPCATPFSVVQISEVP